MDLTHDLPGALLRAQPPSASNLPAGPRLPLTRASRRLQKFLSLLNLRHSQQMSLEIQYLRKLQKRMLVVTPRSRPHNPRRLLRTGLQTATKTTITSVTTRDSVEDASGGRRIRNVPRLRRIGTTFTIRLDRIAMRNTNRVMSGCGSYEIGRTCCMHTVCRTGEA